ncbi:Lactosylceramide 1,3-N-acetyl-beta-D-glucosaminyltransferase B [Toxocara canis]|uniref:Hexosyltransferase n=1 Tax=Toxocara canis TaxID=6265 RepID=A0A0B2V3Y0_TOXCA|nr:Lactosylceramide 1,3-N-acetyl-beta-D-glucosaminyltransferase B [Toxocara canis]
MSIADAFRPLLLDTNTFLPCPRRLIVWQFVWILPYLFLANYLERNLFVFRFICYTQSDLLQLPQDGLQNIGKCSRKFFGARSHPVVDCPFAQPAIALHEPNISSLLQALIVIRSAPNSRDYRDYIRETWKPTVEPQLPVIFVSGTGKNDLTLEAQHYGDILQLDFVDSYVNLTLKMVFIYKFFFSRLPKLKQIIAINDDTIVNGTALKSLESASGISINGKVSRGYPRLIFTWLPWYVPSSIYPNLCYPPFVQGSSFVMTRQAAQRIIENICLFPQFPLDDVFMGILANCLGIRLEHLDGFDRHIADQFIVFHYQWSRYSPQRMKRIWESVNKNI